MSKKFGKLILSKETLRNITTDDGGQIKGRGTVFVCPYPVPTSKCSLVPCPESGIYAC